MPRSAIKEGVVSEQLIPSSVDPHPSAVKTTVCPFCAEEILEGAIRCKHCRSDLLKPCPACKEQIAAQATKCKNGGADLAAEAKLPFAPIKGATPTSGIVFFLLAVLLFLVSFV